MNTDFKYQDVTGKIINAAYAVHSYLGIGFQELIYQKALAWEMKQRDLLFKWEPEIQIYYKGNPKPIGSRRVDFMVEDKILVELKATPDLEDTHFIQINNYLKIYKIEVGLLINFGTLEKPTVRRLEN